MKVIMLIKEEFGQDTIGFFLLYRVVATTPLVHVEPPSNGRSLLTLEGSRSTRSTYSTLQIGRPQTKHTYRSLPTIRYTGRATYSFTHLSRSLQIPRVTNLRSLP
jgi:hypothetical protein